MYIYVYIYIYIYIYIWILNEFQMVSQITNMHSTIIFVLKISKNKQIYLDTKIQKLKLKSYSWLNNKRFKKHFS